MLKIFTNQTFDRPIDHKYYLVNNYWKWKKNLLKICRHWNVLLHDYKKKCENFFLLSKEMSKKKKISVLDISESDLTFYHQYFNNKA